MLSTKVFSSGEDVLNRKLAAYDTSSIHPDKIADAYEIEKCIIWVTTHNYIRIALQFPDELLVDAPLVADLLQDRLSNSKVFILGDTSYGSCCVDEVGAQHYQADSIIHYGHACLSPTSQLPVLYVFPKCDLDITDCVWQVKAVCSDNQMKSILVCDTSCVHAINEIYSELKKSYPGLLNSSLLQQFTLEAARDNGDTLFKTSEATVIIKCGRKIELPVNHNINDYSFIYIGSNEGSTLICLMMTFNRCRFYTYHPRLKLFRQEEVNINRALMKRYYLIERAKDANIVGIVAGTLGVSRYRDMIDHLKSLLKKAGKKSYTFVVGKLNPAKLANFGEVDIYVLVSCPETCLFDQSEFYQPIVSPLELEMACNEARQWTGDYSLDFTEILPGSELYVEAPEEAERKVDCPDVSLINNRVRSFKLPDECDISNRRLDLVNTNMMVATGARNAGEFLANRSWKGLEQKLGENVVEKAIEGQHGVAASYENEAHT